ncbi:MAG: hypothetical protein HYR88_01945 [Verrucomicrobia bacterium]|nr:hypothetical protein [Verrucomicrobiota bacterium]MBI3870775.1 hypothetical protein [Verrucomicrobiota bacterium]
MSTRIECLRCGNTLELAPAQLVPVAVACPACSSRLEYVTFPAFGRGIAPGKAADPVMIEGEGACFFHPRKRAHVPCDLCGRFLCALCDLEVSGKHVCPGCLATAKSNGALPAMERHRFIPESAALTLVCAGVVLPIAIITGPLAIYFAARSFTGEGSLVGRRTFAAVTALLLAVLEIAAAIMIFLSWSR